MFNNQLSVVIIAKNEAHQIAKCIHSAKLVSSDIWVIDSDSSDGMPEIVKNLGVHYANHPWKGYAEQKNYGNCLAKNNWIFSLDADEMLTDALAQEIHQLHLNDDKKVYALNRLNHVGNIPVYHGNWNPDWQNRIFNKKIQHWDTALEVHETLLLHQKTEVIQLKERLLHFTVVDLASYQKKLDHYAAIYRAKNRQIGNFKLFIKQLFSPSFGFLKEFIFKQGYRDKNVGFELAKLHFSYTQKKYRKL